MLPAAARGFLTGPVVQGAGVDWPRPAIWSFFDPTLLSCAKKRGVEPPRRSCFLRWRGNTQGSADPCAIPGVLVKQCLPCRALLQFLPALSFWIAIATRFAAHSTIRLPSSELTVFRRRKAFLLCKNPCGGTAVGMGSPAQSGIAPPAQRNFQRKFALR